MNKRKIDINDVKKKSIKGRKYRNLNVKCESVLPFFKQKENDDQECFQISYTPLIMELLDQINAFEITYKFQNLIIEPIKPIQLTERSFKLDTFNLKTLSSEYPIRQICECMFVFKDEKDVLWLQIGKNKKNSFFKNIRKIYPQFCECTGEKFVLEGNDFKNVYELFKIQWNKLEEKGKISQLEKLQKKICRSLFFIGIIIENNIFYAIDEREQKRKEQLADLGTKSQKKRIIKDVNQHVSSTYSFGSMDIFSNFSRTLKSQKSNEEDLNIKYDYSQKSQKIISRLRHNLFAKAQIKSLKIVIYRSSRVQKQQIEKTKYSDIDLLSSEVENFIIEKAFQNLKEQNQKAYFNHNNHLPINYCYPYSYYQMTAPNIGNFQHNFVQTRKNSNRPPTGKKEFN